MKVLILMPCDEQHVYAATGIYNALPSEYKDKCFSMPMFMEYLRQTNTVDNWIMALFYANVAAKGLIKAETDEDLIVIGNISKAWGNFDIVFNFQEIDEALPYVDPFAAKVKEIIKGEETGVLEPYLNDLYTNKDSKMALKNCAATADFIVDYIESEPKLGAIKKMFEEKMKALGIK